MILADTSVWIEHFRSAPSPLAPHLMRNEVAVHELVIGELALGSLAHRNQTLNRLTKLPHAPKTRHDEVLDFVDAHKLYGRGIGYTDAHLLASTRLWPSLRLWTLDRRLHAAAASLGIAYPAGTA